MKTCNSEANETDSVKNFLGQLETPSLDDSEKSGMERNITQMEINSTIKRMKPGKAPGPDGFPIEFSNKTFGPELIPLLLKVFEEVKVTKKKRPQTMTHASISVLLKKNKDPLFSESYRPVSLLCSDYKILTKVLTNRLEKKYMPKLIHLDQTGFYCRQTPTYLGFCVTYKYKGLFNSNFKTVFNKAKPDMGRWSNLPLSLARRINSVKMSVMPRFLFLVSNSTHHPNQVLRI